jgi:hypothetical protein
MLHFVLYDKWLAEEANERVSSMNRFNGPHKAELCLPKLPVFKFRGDSSLSKLNGSVAYDPIKTFTDLYLDSVQNMIFRIIVRFITDSA